VRVFQGLLVLAPAAANAAFPSISEYEVGSGSVVRPKASGGPTPKKGFTAPVDSASMTTGEREKTHSIETRSMENKGMYNARDNLTTYFTPNLLPNLLPCLSLPMSEGEHILSRTHSIENT
jgi:hypothetical protein